MIELDGVLAPGEPLSVHTAFRGLDGALSGASHLGPGASHLGQAGQAPRSLLGQPRARHATQGLDGESKWV